MAEMQQLCVAKPHLPLDLAIVDNPLRARLGELAAEDVDYWAFKHATERAGATSPYQYPAMMVPEMQRVLIETVLSLQPGISSIIDPFMGSGMVLREGMLLGLDVTGQDINPLAVLLGHTRCSLLEPGLLAERALAVLERARADSNSQSEARFSGLEKWFSEQATLELSRLRRAIRTEGNLDVRRFLWATLAETVRLTSNSRTSTYKLHIRAAGDMGYRSPLGYFERILDRNCRQAEAFFDSLSRVGRIKSGKYLQRSSVHLNDTAVSVVPRDGGYDLLVTSPPYGDNLSTVPYGQSSYLPLQWIDLQDIDEGLDESCLSTTQEIDRRSLGGRHSKQFDAESDRLLQLSPSLATVASELRSEPIDRVRRVVHFFADLGRCLPAIVNSLRPNAYLLWTVGNRRVGGLEIPMSNILLEIAHEYGLVFVDEIERSIVRKRMAGRNQIAATMKFERTLVLRKRKVLAVGGASIEPRIGKTSF